MSLLGASAAPSARARASGASGAADVPSDMDHERTIDPELRGSCERGSGLLCYYILVEFIILKNDVCRYRICSIIICTSTKTCSIKFEYRTLTRILLYTEDSLKESRNVCKYRYNKLH